MTMKTIDQTVLIPAKPQEVYEAWLDPEQHSAMTGGAAGGEAKVGGEFLAWDGYITGKYLELIPGKKIVCAWETSEWPESAEPSRLELTFTEKDGQTEIHLVHSNIPPHDADYETGWHESYWEPMTEYFKSR